VANGAKRHRKKWVKRNWECRENIGQQRKECHVRFDASVGVHSQSLGHRHVGNPATASVAHTLAEINFSLEVIGGRKNIL